MRDYRSRGSPRSFARQENLSLEPLTQGDNPKSTWTGLAGSLRFRQWDAKTWVDDVSTQLL